MKNWIALLFMLVLAGTLLPAVLPSHAQKAVLFSTTEEEHPDSKKDPRAKDVVTSGWVDAFQFLTQAYQRSGFPNIFILLSDDPYLDKNTPPPDVFC